MSEKVYKTMTNAQLDRMLEKGADNDIKDAVRAEIDRRFKKRLKKQEKNKK